MEIEFENCLKKYGRFGTGFDINFNSKYFVIGLGFWEIWVWYR